VTIVVDASALGEYLFRTERAPAVERLVTTQNVELHVPALCDVEVTAILRRALRRRVLTEERARLAASHYVRLPLTRHGHTLLVERILDLRDNFSPYDGAYVALAERLRAQLLTADEHLARAVRGHTSVVLVPVT
jgi:predicted nucleic acid-binding protein